LPLEQFSFPAVCGLPEPRKYHAVAIARFAHEMIGKMKTIGRSLEITLGPDTADLSLRVGIHSGPVTVRYTARNSDLQKSPLLFDRGTDHSLFAIFTGWCLTW